MDGGSHVYAALLALAIAAPPQDEHIRLVWLVPWGDLERQAKLVTHAANATFQPNFRSRLVVPRRLSETVLAFDLREFAKKDNSLRILTAAVDNVYKQDYRFINSDAELPTCSADIFLAYCWTNVSGGQYYDLMGFRNDRERLTRDRILLTLGVNDKDFQKRALVHRSGVTGERRVVVEQVGKTGLKVWRTLDVGYSDRDANQDFLLDLDNEKYTAEEILFETPVGLHGYILSDDVGNLVDSVPEDIAVDTTIPSPGRMRRGGGTGQKILQPGLSCISCHAKGEGMLSVADMFKNQPATTGVAPYGS